MTLFVEPQEGMVKFDVEIDESNESINVSKEVRSSISELVYSHSFGKTNPTTSMTSPMSKLGQNKNVKINSTIEKTMTDANKVSKRPLDQSENLFDKQSISEPKKIIQSVIHEQMEETKLKLSLDKSVVKNRQTNQGELWERSVLFL